MSSIWILFSFSFCSSLRFCCIKGATFVKKCFCEYNKSQCALGVDLYKLLKLLYDRHLVKDDRFKENGSMNF
jgi:hypothetical protein